MTKSQGAYKFAKHIDIRYHFVRERVADGQISVVYCPTKQMPADFLTKALHRDQFQAFRQIIMGHSAQMDTTAVIATTISSFGWLSLI